jgi:hypothetical protein
LDACKHRGASAVDMVNKPRTHFRILYTIYLRAAVKRINPIADMRLEGDRCDRRSGLKGRRPATELRNGAILRRYFRP